MTSPYENGYRDGQITEGLGHALYLMRWEFLGSQVRHTLRSLCERFGIAAVQSVVHFDGAEALAPALDRVIAEMAAGQVDTAQAER